MLGVLSVFVVIAIGYVSRYFILKIYSRNCWTEDRRDIGGGGKRQKGKASLRLGGLPARASCARVYAHTPPPAAEATGYHCKAPLRLGSHPRAASRSQPPAPPTVRPQPKRWEAGRGHTRPLNRHLPPPISKSNTKAPPSRRPRRAPNLQTLNRAPPNLQPSPVQHPPSKPQPLRCCKQRPHCHLFQ